MRYDFRIWVGRSPARGRLVNSGLTVVGQPGTPVPEPHDWGAMPIGWLLLVLALSSGASQSAAQVQGSSPEPRDTVIAGCSGGRSGGGHGLLVTKRGDILEWDRHGPGAPKPDDYTRVGTDSAAATAIFAELARIRFDSISHLKRSDMTCFLELMAPAGGHSVSWPLGAEPPVQLREVRRLLNGVGESARKVRQERWTSVTRAEGAPRRLECSRGRMRSEDVAACEESFDRFIRWFLLVGWAVTVPILLIMSRRTALFRLAELYPPVTPRTRRRRIFASGMVVGKLFYRASTWLTVDDTYLHVSGIGPARLWVPRLSVALSDIAAVPDEFRWGLWRRHTVRLTFARDPGVRFLVWPEVFERLVEASGSRLRLAEPQTVS
jgi:hypothetical protein